MKLVLVVAFLAVSAVRSLHLPPLARPPLRARLLHACLPAELSQEWSTAPVAPAGSSSGEDLMAIVLTWLPEMLQGLDVVCGELAGSADAADAALTAEELLCAQMLGKNVLNGGEEAAEEEDDEFVTVGRPWLHTNAFQLATGTTPAALGQAVWEHATSAGFLAPGGGGGGLLVLVPQLEADFAAFEKLGAAVAAAGKREINGELQVQACHPSADVPAQRCPVPLLQLFVDDPALGFDQAGEGLVMPQ